MGELEIWQKKIVYDSSIVPCVISILGCLLIVFLYLKHKMLRRYPVHLIVELAISDMVFCGSFLIPSYESDEFCRIQAILVSVSGYSGVFFTSVVTYHLFMFYVTGTASREIRGKYLSIFVWVISLILTSIPFITDSYGDSGAWCWIKIKSEAFYRGYFLAFFFIPVSFILCLNVFMVGKLIREVSTNSGFKERKNRLIVKFVMYPVVMVLTISPCFVARVYEYMFEEPNFPMCLLSSVCWSLNGILNSIVYGSFNVCWRRVFDISDRNALIPKPNESTFEDLTD